MATAETAGTTGITDEAVARLRERIGIPEPNPQPPHYTVLTTDVFRHVAEAYGDDNPLWCDPDHAAATRWEAPLAPPPLVGGDTLVGEEEVPRVAPEHRDLMKGDPVGPLVKGPLTVTDMVCWHVGMGMGLYGVRALRLAARNRRRIPRFFHRDPQNVPDVMQRVHWDPEFARRSGNPTTFDYGRMRECWLIHLCTDWMGDDAWLWKLACQFRRFNYVGDTQWLRGTVTRHYLADGDRPAVDVDLVAENQRGEVTTPGHATILLPSREHGPVRLPEPPGEATDLQSALDAIATRFADGTAWSAR